MPESYWPESLKESVIEGTRTINMALPTMSAMIKSMKEKAGRGEPITEAEYDDIERRVLATIFQGIATIKTASDIIEAESPPEEEAIIANPYKAYAEEMMNSTHALQAIFDSMRGLDPDRMKEHINDAIPRIEAEISKLQRAIQELESTPIPEPTIIGSPGATGIITKQDMEAIMEIISELGKVAEEPEVEIEKLDIPGISWVTRRYPGRMRTVDYPAPTEEEKALREFMRLPKLPRSTTP